MWNACPCSGRAGELISRLGMSFGVKGLKLAMMVMVEVMLMVPDETCTYSNTWYSCFIT